MKKIVAQDVQVSGDIPPPRFGHTLTMVSQDKAVLFGGAVSISGINLFIQENSSLLTKRI
jgi:hypothetical protein